MIVNPVVSRKAKETKQCYLQGLYGPGTEAQLPIVFESGMTWKDWLNSPYYVEWPAVSGSSATGQPGTVQDFAYCLWERSDGYLKFSDTNFKPGWGGDVESSENGAPVKSIDTIIEDNIYYMYFA